MNQHFIQAPIDPPDATTRGFRYLGPAPRYGRCARCKAWLSRCGGIAATGLCWFCYGARKEGD